MSAEARATGRGRADFGRLLGPRGIAVVGASADAARIGGQPIRALTEFGYAGRIYPVNPRHREIRGLPCYPDAASVPQPCDVALVAVGARLVPQVLRDCGRAGIPFAIVLSAGFKEVGEKGRALQDELESAIRDSGVRVVGPNCQGLMSPAHAVYCGFGAPFQYAHVQRGKTALVTQSGGFGYAVMSLAEASGIGFSYVVSTGNETDVDAVSLLEHLIDQDDVETLAVYLEGVRDGRALRRLGQRALGSGKPVLVWKVGNSQLGRRAAASHTANLTAPYELYKAAFREGGFIEVRDVDDLVDAVRAFRARRLPAGAGVGVVSVSGGAGVLLADRCEEYGLTLPPLGEATQRRLAELLPEFASAANPADVTAQVFNDFPMFGRVCEAVLNDPAVAQLIVVSASMQGPEAERLALELAGLAKRSSKPVLMVSSAARERALQAFEVLEAAHIPCYPTPGRAAFGAAALWQFASKLARRTPPAERAYDIARHALRFPADCKTLSEHQSKEVLRAYGIPVTREVLLDWAEVGRLQHAPFAFPLVAKLSSPDLLHKTEVGAVRVGLRDLDELKRAVTQMREAAARARPEARVEGVLLQEMASGLEIIAGGLNDPYFGPAVVFGLGGIFAEALRDLSLRFAPFDAATAHAMIGEIRAARILHGYRGQREADVDALADTLSRLSHLLADHADAIAEVDINPLFVRPRGEGVVAADALVVLARA
ncbi:MAG: acetate--CoA ligase family protein [Betaproteobacteria bacterium]|nr:acetate--CoA ligase family protein [Betaproteobacteria bacterium]